MARIRSVHPSLFTDEAWVSCSPLARILYIGLWTDADDQGLFEWRPLQIKMRLLPGDDTSAAGLLAELEEVGLILRYDAAGKAYGAIRDFQKYQRPQKPNALHPMTDQVRDYVTGKGDNSATDTGPVRDQYDSSPVIPPQMEDGGWIGGDSSAAISATTESDWPDGGMSNWKDALHDAAGPGLADPAKESGLITTAVEIVRWRQAGCSWEFDVLPTVRARTAKARASPIRTWSLLTADVMAAKARRLAPLPETPDGRRSELQPEGDGARRPSPRAERMRDDFADIQRAMDGALLDAASGRGGR